MQGVTPDNEVLPSTSEYSMVGLTEFWGKGRKQQLCGKDISSRVNDGWSSHTARNKSFCNQNQKQKRRGKITADARTASKTPSGSASGETKSKKQQKTTQFKTGAIRDTQEGTVNDMADADAWYYEDDGERVKSVLANPQVNSDWRNLLDIDYYRPIARYYCSYYFVSQARDWLPDEVGGVIWFGLDNPENSPFIPMYVGTESVPESWSTLNRDKLDRDSAWWAFALIDDTVNRRYGDLKPKLDEVLMPMQEHMFEMQGIVEQKAFDYLMDGRNDKAKEYLTNYTSSLMNAAEKRYWELSDEFLYELNNNRH